MTYCKLLRHDDTYTVRLNNLHARHYLFVHVMISKRCCWAVFPIFQGDNHFHESFDEYCSFRYRETNVRPIRRKVMVMNEVNNLASVNFGHCGKSKHFPLDIGISIGAASLGIFLGSNVKCLDFRNALK